MKRQKQGFTYIEFLVITAVAGSLLAIAVPNYLEAQVRQKTARVRAESTAMATALELYYVDHNDYVPSMSDGGMYIEPARYRLQRLSTPISYLESVPLLDPFEPDEPFTQSGYQYKDWGSVHRSGWDQVTINFFTRHDEPAWFLHSRGPDGMWAWQVQWDMGLSWEEAMNTYDVTNGTVSLGDIFRFSTVKMQ